MVCNTQGVALGWDVMPRWGILRLLRNPVIFTGFFFFLSRYCLEFSRQDFAPTRDFLCYRFS